MNQFLSPRRQDAKERRKNHIGTERRNRCGESVSEKKGGSHAEQRHKIAHDDLFANYVCPNGKHYLLEFRRFKKRDQCEATGEKFQDHGVLFRQLIDWVCEREIPGAFTFGSYFSSAESLNHIREQKNPQGESRFLMSAI